MNESKIAINSLKNSIQSDWPFRHWVFENFFSDAYASLLENMSVSVVGESLISGERDNSQNIRTFIKKDTIGFSEILTFFKSNQTISEIEKITGIDLKGSALRVEYCLDKTGLYLEPHTDICEKKFTLIYYLVRSDKDDVGTDLFDNKKQYCKTVRSTFNSGFFFVPSKSSWHGFLKKDFPFKRKLLIINYVDEGKWLDKQQLIY